MTGSGERLGGYERSDARVRPLFLFGLALMLLVGGALAASGWISRRMTDELRRAEQVNPMRDSLAPAPGPELQALPAAELAEQRAWEERMLSATEWVDPLNEIVRIPIDRALELVLEEGLPARTQVEEQRK